MKVSLRNYLVESILMILLLGLGSCGEQVKDSRDAVAGEAMIKNGESVPKDIEYDKIKILNFATFHMGASSDANTMEFDENDRKNQEDAKRISEMISKFRPTIICVEYPVEKDTLLNREYNNYLNDPEQGVSWYGEIGLVAFQVARMNGLERLYGIDHKMDYNYMIANEIVNEIDSVTLNDFYENPFKDNPELGTDMDSLNFLEKLKLMNHPKFLDFLIAVNADMLTFAGTDGNFEGADEAAKYYQRNLRIYSNLNRIPMTKDDRVFILSGGSHTAFLREFIGRSPKYEMVDTFEYLN